MRKLVQDIAYALLGLLMAFLFHKLLGIALATDVPVVAVVSPSMQHDNPEVTHYGWLGERFGYNRSFVDSWPIPNGFAMGDMPVIRGTGDYEVGDVIVYSVEGQRAPIIHRIVYVNPDGTFQTKGDNNTKQWAYELRVSLDQIHGEVVFVVPYLGWPKVLLDMLLRVVL